MSEPYLRNNVWWGAVSIPKQFRDGRYGCDSKGRFKTRLLFPTKTNSLTKAKAVLTDAIAKVNKGLPFFENPPVTTQIQTAPTTGGFKFADVVEAYKNDPQINLQKWESYQVNMLSKLNLLKETFRGKTLEEMTPDFLATWFNKKMKYRQNEAGKRILVNAWNLLDYKSHLDRIFKFAVGKDFTSKNPIEKLRLANPDFFPKQPKGRIVKYTKEDHAAILKATYTLEKKGVRGKTPTKFPMPLFRDILDFRLLEATRIQEALNIQVKEISKQVIENQRTGKKELQWFAQIKESKNGQAREIPIFKQARAIISRNVVDKAPNDYVFSSDGKRLITRNLRSPWNKIIKEAAKERPSLSKMHFYDYRHVSLTNHAARHVGESLLGALAGQIDPRSTKIYINLTSQQVAEGFRSAGIT